MRSFNNNGLSDDEQTMILTGFESLAGGSENWHLNKPKAGSRTGQLFQLSHRSNGEAYAVKTFAKAQQAQAQFLLLQESRQRMGEGVYSVPRVYEVAQTQAALRFEWISLPTLNTVLLNNSFCSGKRLVVVAEVGRWLRHFHDAWGREYRPIDLALEATRINLPLRNKPDLAVTLLNDAIYARACRLVTDFAGTETALPPILYSKQHGDFTPSNIMLDGDAGRVYGIDLSTSHKETLPITRDLTRFLSYLAARQLTSFGITGRYAREAHAFLSAYDPALNITPKVFAFLHLCELLRRWGSLQIAVVTAGRSWARSYERYRLRALAAYLSAALSG